MCHVAAVIGANTSSATISATAVAACESRERASSTFQSACTPAAESASRSADVGIRQH